MQLEYLMDNNNKCAKQNREKMSTFILMLEMAWPFMFGTSQKSLVQALQNRLRRPEELLEEEDLVRLKDFCASQIQKLVND